MAEEQKQHKEEPIIIKKKKGHGGHGAHGGAWKVAYADFVTAMMAFFIVMWIMGQSDAVKKSVTAYFKDPGAFNFITGKRAIPVDLNMRPKEGEGDGKGNDGQSKSKAMWMGDELQDSIVKKLWQKAKEDSTKAGKRMEDMAKEFKKIIDEELAKKPVIKDLISSIKVEMTKEGLRIELIESSENLFFEVGSAVIKKEAKEILDKLAIQIGQLPNPVDIEGHTDARQYSGKAGYSNWELSSDRANAARRILESNGLWDGQVAKVTGFADRRLREPNNPFDVSNRRISILIKQMSAKDFFPPEKLAGVEKNDK